MSKLILATAAVSAALQLTASAQYVISNLGITGDTSFALNSSSSPAASFTVGSQAHTLDAATLRLSGERANKGGDGVVTYHAFIYSSSGGEPGSLLYSLGSYTDSSGDHSAYSAHAFTAPGGSLLSPNTTYWVVATVNSGDSGSWEAKFPPVGSSGVGGWSIGASSRFIGETFQYDSIPLFGISATPVPEPSEYAALTGLALAGFALWRRRSAT